MADEISLTVEGKRYSGWQTAEVTRGIEAVSGAFTLGVSELWANQDKPWPIRDGDACSVKIGDEKLITGFVDRRDIAFDAASHSITVQGRDRTADIVDSSVDLDAYEFKNLALDKLAAKLCDPHSINVSVQSGLQIPKSPPKVRVSRGARVFDVLEEACRLAGIFAISDGNGGLILTRAGSARAATDLVEGENILAASGQFDMTARYAKYVVLGQRAGTDEDYGEKAARVKGEATDSNVRENRVLVVRAEGNVTNETAKTRARWEASVRAARAGEITITVQGWKQGNGKLWPINSLVKVKSQKLRVDGDLLIVKATYKTGNGGTTTRLELKRPDAFQPESARVKSDNTWHEISRGV